MLKLSDVFNELSYGELAHHFIGGKPTDGIAAEHWPEIISHINHGLTALYSRFPLKYCEAIIQQYEDIQTYYLRSKYAMSNQNSTSPVRYIMDSEFEPFTDNVIQIDSVYSEFGEKRTLNDETDIYTVYTPQYDAIVKPYNCKDNAMAVVYKANHDRIKFDGVTPANEIEIDIPIILLEPLLFFITSRILNGMGGANVQEASMFTNKYELSCMQISNLGLINKESLSNYKLENNGWV
mgnify:CR=1 FL=1